MVHTPPSGAQLGDFFPNAPDYRTPPLASAKAMPVFPFPPFFKTTAVLEWLFAIYMELLPKNLIRYSSATTPSLGRHQMSNLSLFDSMLFCLRLAIEFGYPENLSPSSAIAVVLYLVSLFPKGGGTPFFFSTSPVFHIPPNFSPSIIFLLLFPLFSPSYLISF